MTFDQWWYDYKIKHGLKDSREVVAMAAWQAALATQRAEPLPPRMIPLEHGQRKPPPRPGDDEDEDCGDGGLK